MILKLKNLISNERLMSYIKNSSWMLFEYITRLISSIFVAIYVARYLGPEKFGILTYALSIVSIFLVISRLGMDSILVRDISKNLEKIKTYMGTAFSLMLISSIFCILVLGVLVEFFEQDAATKVYIWIISLSLLFQTLFVVDYSFQAEVKAKYASISKVFAFILISIIKIYLVFIEAELLTFVYIYAFEYLIIGLFLLFAHYLKRDFTFLLSSEKSLVKPIMQSAWPLTISALASILYMRVDQIMIKNMLSSYDLGIYSSAVKIYEGWIMIPYVLSISLLPAIVKLKKSSPEKYTNGLIKVFSFIFWGTILVSIFTTIFSENILLITFGEEYVSSSSILIIFMWASVFVAQGTISARYLTVEKLEKKIAKRTIVALVINVTLNYIFIPIYGLEAAAFTTFISIFVSNYLMNYIDKDLRNLFSIQNQAMILKFLKKKG